MTLDKKRNNERGTYKIAYSSDTKLLSFQWHDSKVVNCVSSLLDFRRSGVQRQVGSVRKSFACPSALKHYQENMGGVDKGDQMRGHFGGFAAQSHFKKWYKKTLMAVLDCMLLNALRLWNMSCESQRVTNRRQLNRHEFINVISQEMLEYKTECMLSPLKDMTEETLENRGSRDNRPGVLSHVIEQAVGDRRCRVCMLEGSIVKRKVARLRIPITDEIKQKLHNAKHGNRAQLSHCKHCGLYAHNSILINNTKHIHDFFPNMTCMEILHSKKGMEIWNINRGGKVTVNYKNKTLRDLGLVLDDVLNK
jgi:Transposase IS4